MNDLTNKSSTMENEFDNMKVIQSTQQVSSIALLALVTNLNEINKTISSKVLELDEKLRFITSLSDDVTRSIDELNTKIAQYECQVTQQTQQINEQNCLINESLVLVNDSLIIFEKKFDVKFNSYYQLVTKQIQDQLTSMNDAIDMFFNTATNNITMRFSEYQDILQYSMSSQYDIIRQAILIPNGTLLYKNGGNDLTLPLITSFHLGHIMNHIRVSISMVADSVCYITTKSFSGYLSVYASGESKIYTETIESGPLFQIKMESNTNIPCNTKGSTLIQYSVVSNSI